MKKVFYTVVVFKHRVGLPGREGLAVGTHGRLGIVTNTVAAAWMVTRPN